MIKKSTINILFTFTILFPIISFASINHKLKSSIEFYASNNTGTIDLQTAFARLTGDEQQKLEDTTIVILQNKHIQQTTFQKLLGAYRMSSSQAVTADNSEKIMTSPMQKISTQKIFNIAKELGNTLNQESVAVFIPENKSTKSLISDTVLKLKSHSYTITEVTSIISNTLPDLYNQAFSLHFKNSNISTSYENTIVDEVEWLGSQIQPEIIQNSFPLESIDSYYGAAYLVYKNGNKIKI